MKICLATAISISFLSTSVVPIVNLRKKIYFNPMESQTQKNYFMRYNNEEM